MKLVVISFVICLLLCACASEPQHATSTDRAAFSAITDKYVECLGTKSAEYIRGSDDVALLTKNAMSLCESNLGELNKEILARGFSPAYARGYVGATRKDGEQMALSGILKMKSGEQP